MANQRIKGIIVEIGGDTTKLGKALKDISEKNSKLSGELSSINRLLKLDPNNTELLTQKQKVLAETISNTKEKLEALKSAEAQLQEQAERGDVTEAQMRELRREIIDTTNKLQKCEAAAKETAEAIERVGNNADGTSSELKEVADNTENAEKASEDLGSSLDGTLSTGFKTVIAVATAASAALVGCAESSREYRNEMGKLDTSFTTSGHNSETAKNTYKDLQGVLGETDQAVEASNHLAKLADTEEDLSKATHALTGVYATFGASLPVEALAESANESARSGAIAGNLADAINWAAKAGETFGVTMKESTEENEEWNKSVQEAQTAEDYFNLALQECNDEQERQQLIIETLTDLYGDAADQYKKTNEEIIRSNEANEEWNETIAEVGENVEPVITDIKKFGTELVKNAEDPLKRATAYVRNTVLPTLNSMSSWAFSNIPTIKSLVVGATATLVAYKVATISVEVAHKGLTGAIMATTVAQKALNIAQAATPWGLAAAAIAGVLTALVTYATQVDETSKKVDTLTEEERQLISAANETAQALRNQKTAAEEASGGIVAQMDYVKGLANELQTLSDKSGKVKEADQARAQFILNELNTALGTEYQMTDGIIQKYDELATSVYEVIEAKTANALLEANNDTYVAAIQAEDALLKAATTAQTDYNAQKEKTIQAQEKYQKAYEELQKKIADNAYYTSSRQGEAEEARVKAYKLLWENEQKILEEKNNAYEEALTNQKENLAIQENYAAAQEAVLQKNYSEVKKILSGKSVKFYEYADHVDEATAKAVDKLFKEAYEAGIAAEKIKQNFEQGIEGYTAGMKLEAESAADQAFDAWADAYIKANGIGKDIGTGLVDGIESTRNALMTQMEELIADLLGTARDEADCHSPSRKMVDFGEDLGEGPIIGLENKTNAMLKTARNQVSCVLDVYNKGFDPTGQTVVNRINKQDVQRQSYELTKAATQSKGGVNLGGISFHIDKFVNSTDKDIHQLTEEVMEVAENYIRRKDEAFA